MLDKLKKSFKVSNKKKIIITFGLTFIFIYATLITTLVTTKYDFNVGDIASTDIKAPREIEDKNETEKRQEEAANKVDKQYTLKKEVQIAGEENINVFFEKLTSIKDSSKPENDKITELNEAYKNFKGEELKELLALSKDSYKNMQKSVLDALNDVYQNPIEEDKLQDVAGAKTLAKSKIMQLDYSKNIKSILDDLVNEQIKPNFFYDKEKTEEKIKEVTKTITPIMIKKNQLIVKEGTPITDNQIKILSDLGLLNDSSINIKIYLSLAVYVGCILLLQYFYLYKYYKKIFVNSNKMILISVISVIALVLARSVSIISPYLIPLACAPILYSLLINYKVATVLSILNCTLISACVGFSPEITILALLNAVLGATALKKMQQRNDILYTMIYVSVISSLITFSTGIILSSNLQEIFQRTALSMVACILSGILAIGLLPFFESTFDVVTTVKLLELSNPNNPLLKKLLMEAPGTYHHSMLVANLAEYAAEEIGGNPVLARIGAYYHDVGKTKRAVFFKENQMTRENPHDKINPDLSARIITDHVKDGLILAEQYNLPKDIKDIIEQHHGNTLVKYFYITMKNNSENPELIDEQDYRYKGSIPNSKEAGIIMLADSVEAAVRSINEPTTDKIKVMIDNIFEDKLKDGQFNDSQLTFKDFTKIKQCFLKTLNSIYHQRIEYPEDKNKKE